MKNTSKYMVLFAVFATLISCNDSTGAKVQDNHSEMGAPKGDVLSVDSTADKFTAKLKAGEPLESFFSDNWTFVYHEDNRCDGSTDGQRESLAPASIDAIITLEVKNDGEAWACDKKEPRTFELGFDLKKKVKEWDRFEIPNYEDKEKNTVYILGQGESDYIELHFDENNLIETFEYRSEDPG